MSDQFFWFTTRGAGIMAWFASCASVLVGVMMSSRVLGRRPTLPWLTDLHRYFGAMAMAFLAIHMVTLAVDPFVSFSWAELFIPGEAEVPGLSRLSLAWGVLAAWLLAIVEATSLIKKRLPARFWHTIHLTSFATVVLGAIHGIEVGSDTESSFVIAPAASVLTAVVLVTAIRASRYLSDRQLRYQATDQPAPRGASQQRQRRQPAARADEGSPPRRRPAQQGQAPAGRGQRPPSRRQAPPERDQAPSQRGRGAPPRRQAPPPEPRRRRPPPRPPAPQPEPEPAGYRAPRRQRPRRPPAPAERPLRWGDRQ